MWIELTPDADPSIVKNQLQALGLWATVLRGAHGHGLRVEVDSKVVAPEHILAIPGVADLRLASSKHPEVDARAGRLLRVAGHTIGGGTPVLLAGPCSVESEAQIHEAAAMVARAGATFLRGGVYKPRTSPYAFQGVGPRGLPWMRAAADAWGLGVITEVMSEHDVDVVAAHADIIQLGARNMQNYALLRAVGEAGKPVMLKRGMHAYVSEWLLAGEYLLSAGAGAVIFCERGIRSFEPSSRNLLDLTAVAQLKHVHGQIVIADPSHACGRRDLIPALSRASLAAGADGVILEAHPDPASARSDGPQALHREEIEAIGRDMGLTPLAAQRRAGSVAQTTGRPL